MTGDEVPDFDALIGVRGQPFRIPIERGKIREFASATRTTDRDYLDDESPAVPPTFLMTAAYWQGPENRALGGIRLTARRGLHAEQEFIFHGPLPRAGEQLVGQERVDSVEHKVGKRGGELTFVTVVTDFRDESGVLRAEARTTLVQTSRAVGGDA